MACERSQAPLLNVSGMSCKVWPQVAGYYVTLGVDPEMLKCLFRLGMKSTFAREAGTGLILVWDSRFTRPGSPIERKADESEKSWAPFGTQRSR